MALIPPETIEQIAAATDIVDLIGSYFPLRRAGPAYKAICPFHQEKTPSFTVNPQRQIFKCFGCGAGGTVFKFVELYENVSFPEAARKLAERAGITLVEAEMSPEDEARFGMRKRLLALHAEAAEFFHYWLLKKPEAQIARDYLKGRGISGDIARNWKLGYAPDSWDAFLGHARERGFGNEEIAQSGLVSARDSEQSEEQNRRGQFYDRFRNRVMFPICNDTGEVIAFSGRVLEADAKAAKYVNSPETMLFTKGAVLFGLNKSKRALIDKQQAIVCEGQLDLITAFEAGVQNVIAPQGTAFTPKQAHILKRYVEEVVLCFDADAAGEKAAERSLASLLAESLVVRVVEMPAGEDPDSLIRQQGPDVFVERITQARDFFDYQLNRESQRPDFGSPRGKLQTARKLASFVSLVSDSVLREAVANKISTRLEISTGEFTRLLQAPKKNDNQELEPVAVEPLRLDPTLRLLTLVAIRDATARAWLLEEAWDSMLQDEPNGELLVKVLGADLNPDEPGSVSAFLATLNSSEQATLAVLLDEKPPQNAMAIAADCWRELERRQIRRRMDAIQARMRAPGLEADDVTNLQKEILDLTQRLSHISRPLSPPL